MIVIIDLIIYLIIAPLQVYASDYQNFAEFPIHRRCLEFESVIWFIMCSDFLMKQYIN